MKNNCLRKKLFTYFSIGSLISIVFVSIFAYYIMVPDILESEQNNNQKLLESSATNIETFISKQVLDVEVLRDSIFDLKNENEIKNKIDAKIKNNQDIEDILVFNQNDFFYGHLSSNREEANLKLNKLLLQQKTPIIYDNNVYIITSAKVNQTPGYIVVQLKNTSIQSFIKYNDKKPQSIIYQSKEIFSNIYDLDSSLQEEDIEEITSKYQLINSSYIVHKDKVVLIKNIPNSEWMIINIWTQKDFYHNAWGTIYKLIATIGLYILLTLILLATISYIFINFTHKIVGWIKAIQKNDFSFKIKYNSLDLFSEIAENFKKMVNKWKSNYEELQKQAEELYERNWQVEQANKEIEESYQKLQETIYQLNEAEEKYYSLVKNLPEIISIIELDGTIVFVNDVVKDILGYNKGELIGKNIDFIVGQKLSNKLINIMNKRLKKQKKVMLELPMQKKDGRTIITEIKLTYYLCDGNVEGVQAIIRDITKNKKLQNEIVHRNEELLTIYNISKSLSSTIELDNVFNLIVSEVCKLLEVDMCILRTLDFTGKNLILRAYSGKYFKEIEEQDLKEFTILSASKILNIIGNKQIIKEEDFDPGWSISLFNNKKPNRERIKEIIFMPISAKEKMVGLIVVGTITQVNEKRLNILNSIANNAAVAIENATLYENSKKYFIKTIEALIAAVEAKDKYTEGHSRRVSRYVEVIGREMGISKEKIEDLKIAGILHDVGKIGISDSILLKPSKLTQEEYEEVKQHPIISNRILYSVGLSETTMKAIACHHERYDGGGYPFGLKADELSIECQIIAVADALDAMTSNRAYRGALTFDQAIKEIIKNKGSQFGPEVVDVLTDLYEKEREKITCVCEDLENIS